MKKLLFILLVINLALMSCEARAGDCTNVKVKPPTERTDNTSFALNEIGGYKFYMDRDNDQVFESVVDVPSQGATTMFCVPRSENTFTVGITIYDTEGRESDPPITTSIPAWTPPTAEKASPKRPLLVCSGGATCK